jgi:hypothetical protein
MRKKNLARRLATVASVAALLVPLASVQATAAPAAPQAPAAPSAADRVIPGAYISPWGDAEVRFSPEFNEFQEREGVTVEAIEPFRMHPDGHGVHMPIGSTAGDGLDARGRIFYPGGLTLRHQATGDTATLKPTYIRVMPRPGYSAGVSFNGRPLSDEIQIGDTDYAEAMASARPSPTGFRMERIPFYFTREAESAIESHTSIDAPEAGTPMFTLSPDFDYIPTRPGDGAAGGGPGIPGLPG